MPKLRKQRRRKRFRYNINRKRLRNRIENQGNIQCKEIKAAWEKHKSLKTNFAEMGLSYDPNVTLPITKKLKTNPTLGEEDEEQVKLKKGEVLEQLIAEAKAPRARVFRFPKGQVEWITYLMDKYGNDYKAMALDKKNYNQETWKQLRSKIKRFKNIPEQYNVYLKQRGNTTEDSDVEMSDGEV